MAADLLSWQKLATSSVNPITLEEDPDAGVVAHVHRRLHSGVRLDRIALKDLTTVDQKHVTSAQLTAIEVGAGPEQIREERLIQGVLYRVVDFYHRASSPLAVWMWKRSELQIFRIAPQVPLTHTRN